MEEYSSISNSGFIENPFRADSGDFFNYSEIESNGYNLIYKAQRYGKLFILKGLKPEFRNNPFYLALLEKEFDISLKLDHPNIVRVIEKRQDKIIDDCIVMEYIDGVTLKEFLQTPHSQSDYDKIISELLNAMSYYHSKQIVHRDLKPSNILITNNGNNVKIIDFGLSDSDYHAILKQPAGSEKYAAPEQYNPNIVIDCRADIYAFGLIVSLILKDKTPYYYRSVINNCTQVDRNLRYNNADIIIKQLKKYPQRKRLFIELSVFFIMLIAILLPLPQRIKTNKEAAFKEIAKVEIIKAYQPYIDSLTNDNYPTISDCSIAMSNFMNKKPTEVLEKIKRQIPKKYWYYLPELEIVIDNEQNLIIKRCIVIIRKKFPEAHI